MNCLMSDQSDSTNEASEVEVESGAARDGILLRQPCRHESRMWQTHRILLSCWKAMHVALHAGRTVRILTRAQLAQARFTSDDRRTQRARAR